MNDDIKQKQKIKSNFDAASITYDAVASTQKDIASDLIAFYSNLSNKISQNSSILDIGTGTGFLPEILLKKYNNININFILNDISNNMLLQAKQKFNHQYKDNNFSFICGDIESKKTQEEIFNKKYDFIISNLSLQWMDNIEILIEKFLNHTQDLAFTTLCKGTFEQIENLFIKNNRKPPTANYLSFEDLSTMMNDILKKFQSEKKIHTMKKQYFLNFDTFYEYRKYIKKLGVGINFNYEINTEIQNNNQSFIKDSENISLNYNVFFCVIL